MATVSNPARTISVTVEDGYTSSIALKPDALFGSEQQIADRIVAVAQLAHARDTADTADRLVAAAIERGDDQTECRRFLHGEGKMPTQADVDDAYAQTFRNLNIP
jgi:hypothetical protein